MLPGLNLCSTCADPAQHPITTAIGSTVGDLDDLNDLDDLDDLDCDLSQVCKIVPKMPPFIVL